MGNLSNEYEVKFISEVEKKERKNGNYKKAVFHIHTPASHDYKIFDKCEENQINKCITKTSEEELINKINEMSIFPPAIDLKSFNIEYLDQKYENKIEFLIYLLMAGKLLRNNIEVALITDHNTIGGYRKLASAVKYIHDLHKSFQFCEIILGIEISCADKNHVVGIFPNNAEIENSIENMLKDILMNEKDGSYLTSIEIIDKINSLGGLAYIAHINTSDIFKEKYLSGAYKKKLFNNENLNILGVSDIVSIPQIKQKLSNFIDRNKEFCYFIDEDSHTIEKLATTHFWIKGNKVNFEMIRNAVRDYKISIEIEKPKKPAIYIRGMMITPWENKGFFCKNNIEQTEPLIISFSDSLSCLIGGRGTGKSTILKLLDFVLTQKCSSPEELTFFCKNRYVYILAKVYDMDYLIKFSSPKIDDMTKTLWYFNQARVTDEYRTKKIDFDSEDVADYVFIHYLHVYLIDKNKKKHKLETVEKRNLLTKILDQQYSINELVEKSKTNEIDKYIFDKMFANKTLTKPDSSFFQFHSIDGLKTKLENLNELIERRISEVNKVLAEFNDKQKGLLKIDYNFYYDQSVSETEIKSIFWLNEPKNNKFYKNFNITKQNTIEYIFYMLNTLSLSDLLLAIINEKYNVFKLSDLKAFCVEINDNNRTYIETEIAQEKDKILFLNALKRGLCNINSQRAIRKYYGNYLRNNEGFDLLFNLNSNESDKNKPELYRSIKNLSLGQKVVALLDFIIGYSDFNEDLRPLLIDQPEDNLDNRYIYKNLVKQLRDIKSNRQVIIATHNSTIVTNAKAETVVVLESDNERAWVKKSGYPYEEEMIKHIINYLEGGKESFKHKAFVYAPIIDKDKN